MQQVIEGHLGSLPSSETQVGGGPLQKGAPLTSCLREAILHVLRGPQVVQGAPAPSGAPAGDSEGPPGVSFPVQATPTLGEINPNPKSLQAMPEPLP